MSLGGSERRAHIEQSRSSRSPSAIPVFVGPLVRSRHIKTRPIYFEVSFVGHAAQGVHQYRLDAIVFRNFYCSHITIKQRQRFDRACDNPWVTILRDRPLMEDPHHEDDAQYWHVVAAEEFDAVVYDAKSSAPLRFYLYQPSPMWNTIGLQHVKCVNWSDELGVNGVEDRDAETLVERGEAESGLGQMCKSISEQV